MRPRMIPGNVSDEVWARWPVKLKGVQKNCERADQPKTDEIRSYDVECSECKGCQRKNAKHENSGSVEC